MTDNPTSSKPARPRRLTAKSATTREHLLAAAQALIQEEGLARFSTRALARRAGVAEGTLYHHFPDKHSLVTECIGAKAMGFSASVAELPLKVGTGEVRDHLVEVGRAALRFFDDAIVTMCAVLSDSAALSAHRTFMQAAWQAQGTGPDAELQRIASYLRAEQRLGRVNAQSNPEVVASMLIACMTARSMKDTITGRTRTPEESEAHVRDVVSTLGWALEPTV